MQRLLGKLLLFFGASLLLVGTASYGIHRETKELADNQLFVLEPNRTTLIAGDSHPETAFDPHLVPHIANVSASSENYFYSYYKLRFLLEKNPQVRTVGLGFSPHNLARRYQESFLFGDRTYVMESYFWLLDDPGRAIVRSRWTTFLLNCLKYDFGVPLEFYRNSVAQRLLLDLPLRPADVPFLGGYKALRRSHLERRVLDRKISRYFLDGRAEFSGISPLMEEFLERIIRLCEDRGATLYLINTPLHATYRAMIPPEAEAEYARLSRRLPALHPHVQLLDWSREPLDDRLFFDGDHLNLHGTAVVSEWLRRELTKHPHG